MSAAQAAAAAAAQINSKLGITSPGGVPQVGSAGGSADMFGGGAFGLPQTENISVPDRMVGLCESIYLPGLA